MNKRAGNATHMKIVNRKTILNMIRECPISRADLARKTGLTRAAVTMIVDSFIQDKIVLETGVSRTRSGRSPIILELNPNRYYALSLDLSRTGYHLGLVDLMGKVVLAQSIHINAVENPLEAVDLFTETLKKIISASEIKKDKLLGLGVSSPGPVDIQNGIILNPPNFSMWHY